MNPKNEEIYEAFLDYEKKLASTPEYQGLGGTQWMYVRNILKQLHEKVIAAIAKPDAKPNTYIGKSSENYGPLYICVSCGLITRREYGCNKCVLGRNNG